MKKVYTDEFKLQVIQDYYQSPLGIRMIAQKYSLPSKNYVTKWEDYLKKKGLLPPDSTKPNKTSGRTKDYIAFDPKLSEREKQYELEIEQLKAQVAYFESLEYIKPFLKKTKKSGK